MDLGGTVSTPLIRGIALGAERLGVDPSAALAKVGLDAETLLDSDFRAPRGSLYRIWDILGEQSGDECLGLHIAETAQVGDFAVLDYAMRNSPTLGTAFEQASRYAHVLHNAVDVEFLPEAGQIRARPVSDSPRHMAEWMVAAWTVVGRQIVGERWTPSAVSFHHAAPASTQEHERLFEIAPTFLAPWNQISFDPALCSKPVVAADPQLFEVVRTYASQLLEQVPRSASTSDQVKHVIAGVLDSGDTNLELVARELSMAPRTLQRKLKGEGVSFQALLDDVRYALAVRYLSDASLAVEETAFLVGFSEPSAFNRAFKRWSGETPSAFRPAR